MSNKMSELVTHCQGLFKWANGLETAYDVIAVTLIVLTAGLLFWQSQIEIRKMRDTIPLPPKDDRTLTQSAVEFVEALPNLINALAKAPAPIVMLTLAMLLIIVPDSEPGSTCLAAFEATQGTEK